MILLLLFKEINFEKRAFNIFMSTYLLLISEIKKNHDHILLESVNSKTKHHFFSKSLPMSSKHHKVLSLCEKEACLRFAAVKKNTTIYF